MSDLDREDVRAWLERLPSDAEAGITGNYDSCPLAMYLKDCYCTDEVVVTDTRYSVGEDTSNLLPDWAREYVERIDRYPGTEDGEPFEDQVVISAGAALALLDPVDAGKGA